MPVAETIEHKLKAGLAPVRLTVTDQSHLHAGHAGARPGGETHFRVEIVSASFRGMTRVARQREVHRLLAAEPGCVIGPLPVDGRYHVTMVTGRGVPTLDNAHVASRARTMFLDRIAHRAVREHVSRRRVSS